MTKQPESPDIQAEAVWASANPALRDAVAQASYDYYDALMAYEGAIAIVASRRPSFAALLNDPTQQLDRAGIVMASVLEYQNAKTATMSATPSAEPDGEGCRCPDALSKARIECDICTPAQDGAEVEALARILMSDAVMNATSSGFEYAKDEARAILASDWLAQRDKDRDAAVAAKALTDFADWCLPQKSLTVSTVGFQDLIRDYAARAAAPAGEQ